MGEHFSKAQFAEGKTSSSQHVQVGSKVFVRTSLASEWCPAVVENVYENGMIQVHYEVVDTLCRKMLHRSSADLLVEMGSDPKAFDVFSSCRQATNGDASVAKASARDGFRQEPKGFWLLESCLACDQRQLDCMADIGCGVYDSNYGSRGTHICSAAPCVGLTNEELAIVRSNNRSCCGQNSARRGAPYRDDYEVIM